MSERREYSDETKAAVMAALLSGQSLSKVATEYKIPKSTVANWSAEARRAGLVPNEKRERIGELLLDYLEANLIALKAQAEVFANAEWIQKQPASEVAVLHGVIADKGIRLLEALAQSNADDSGAEDAPAA